MSVLNMSGDEQTECPLCMEPLEMDDLNFFPCTCGYQICRFCWHRIRTDENGLCPACRKAYPENPADFKPLTHEELQKIKAEKRQKDQQRKQKITENRKHLANVRVVQKNLVFVVGLSPRLAELEVLKKHEYFGKFGKIHKVVINHSTTYAGSQGPSASAYVTYNRAEDALRAIQAVNNIYVDGRTLKASLGTTKYCSHFMKNQTCPKPDCMYLHELGDDAASFTKEEMQQGKHQEYERKLQEQLFNPYHSNIDKNKDSRKLSSPPVHTPNSSQCSSLQHTPPNTSMKDAWPSLGTTPPSNNNNKGDPPQISSKPNSQQNYRGDTIPHRVTPVVTGSSKSKQTSGEDGRGKSKEKCIENGKGVSNCPPSQQLQNQGQNSCNSSPQPVPQCPHPQISSRSPSELQRAEPKSSTTSPTSSHSPSSTVETSSSSRSTQSGPNFSPPSNPNLPPRLQNRAALFGQPEPDNHSFFSSSSGFSPCNKQAPKPPSQAPVPDWLKNGVEAPSIAESLPQVCTSTDWQAAFGFNSSNRSTSPLETQTLARADDDLGFDPFHETQKALAEMIEVESLQSVQYEQHPLTQHPRPVPPQVPGPRVMDGYSTSPAPPPVSAVAPPRSRLPPPGFSGPNHVNAFSINMPRPPTNADLPNSKIFPFVGLGAAPQNHLSNGPAPPAGVYTDLTGLGLNNHIKPDAKPEALNMKEWQDGLRALFPNINITFGGVSTNNFIGHHQPPQQILHHTRAQNDFNTPAPHNIQIPSNKATSPGCHLKQGKIFYAVHHNSVPGWRSNNPDWTTMDPAIVSSGQLTDSRSDSPPHWMKSLEQLTETGPMYPSLLPFNNLNFIGANVHPNWTPTAAIPPPGFSQFRPPKPSEPQKIENL